MEAFQIGPFDYNPGKVRTLNGVPQTEWSLFYGSHAVASSWVPGDRARVIEALADQRAAFIDRLRAEHAQDQLALRRWDDAAPLDVIDVSVWPAGLSGCLPDDSSDLWVEVVSTTHRMPVSLPEWGRIMRKHAAPALGWIACLLPSATLERDPQAWRAPSSWELRHLVGEGSFTGVTGAAAAALVGVTPQNFRKYLARDGASTRQAISYAMWHLLLQRLQVQVA